MSTACTNRTCGRPATITARDGGGYCKAHGDRLPPYLRHHAGAKSGAPPRARARQDRGDPYRAHR